jgi:hypothetical protein
VIKSGGKKSCSTKPRNHMYVSKDCQENNSTTTVL